MKIRLVWEQDIHCLETMHHEERIGSRVSRSLLKTESFWAIFYHNVMLELNLDSDKTLSRGQREIRTVDIAATLSPSPDQQGEPKVVEEI